MMSLAHKMTTRAAIKITHSKTCNCKESEQYLCHTARKLQAHQKLPAEHIQSLLITITASRKA